MAEDQDQEQKTEQPTSKRLEEAFKKGNIPFSREVTSFFMLGALALTVSWFSPSIVKNTGILLTPFIADADSLPTDSTGLGHVLRKVAFGALFVIIAPLAASIVAALAAGLMQNGFVISAEPLVPKLSKLSPLAGIKRIFSMRTVVEFIKNISKLIVIGFVAFIAVYPELVHIRQLPATSQEGMLIFLKMLAVRMTIGVAIAMFMIALFDLVYQRFAYIKSLRMTRQEIRDEYKQSEGDPIIKQRLRQLRQERSRRRMMSAVPKADVVITNPTHYAIALVYNSTDMKAPIVVAKGQDLIALRIRQIAEENKVPIVENPPLARALFTSTEIEEEIPMTHYEAVAKVISYVYQLKGRKI